MVILCVFLVKVECHFRFWKYFTVSYIFLERMGIGKDGCFIFELTLTRLVRPNDLSFLLSSPFSRHSVLGLSNTPSPTDSVLSIFLIQASVSHILLDLVSPSSFRSSAFGRVFFNLFFTIAFSSFLSISTVQRSLCPLTSLFPPQSRSLHGV